MTRNVSASILISFFHDATDRLNIHPSTATRLKLLRPSTLPDTGNDNSNNGSDDADENSNITPQLDSNHRYCHNDEYYVPISLDQHRLFLMDEQLQSLKSCISQFKNDQGSEIATKDNRSSNDDDFLKVTVEDVQSRLRELGSKNLSNIDWGGDEKVKDSLFSRMAEMNNAARLAFARSIVWAEVEWEEYFRSRFDNTLDISGIQIQKDLNKEITTAGRQSRHLRQTGDDKGPMDRSAIMEFFGLCSTAVRLPEILDYFQDGRLKLPTSKDEVQEDSTLDRPGMARSFLPHYWIMNLQYMILRALGYDHEFGMMELRSAIQQAEHYGDKGRESDSELERALLEFSTALQEAESVATSKSLSVVKDGLSDQHAGGVTRVTSVKFSEKIITPEGDFGTAPLQERMEQHHEDDKKAQLQMVQKAAALQQSIVASLLGMEEKERNEKLEEAKKVHEEFMNAAMQLPPGPERVNFMQNINPEKQKMLLIHKFCGQSNS